MNAEAIPEYANASDALIYGAMAAYAIALVAFSMDLAVLADKHKANGRRRAAAIAQAVTWAGFLLHFGGVLLRGLAVQRVPWANMYEFAITATLFAVMVYLGAQFIRDLRFLGAPLTAIVLLILGAAMTLFYVDARDLVPALQNYWLVIHVSIATISVGVLTVAFLLSVLQLLLDKQRKKEAAAPDEERGGWGRLLTHVGTPLQLEGAAFRLNAIGFVLWTFTLVAGSIWAEHAWGRFWGWDPKEVWTFIIWVVYAAYLHARTTRGWAGPKSAWFAIVGFACVIFNYTIVNMFFNSIHAYSGIG